MSNYVGKPDCIVIDEYGQLGIINPISGQWLWKLKDKSSTKIDVLNFPLILPDLNGDGIYDLLYATTEGIDIRNSIRIISGNNGQPIGDAYKLKECTYIHKFQLNDGYMISFNCICNETEVQRFKTLSELYSLTTNKSLIQKLIPSSRLAQHKLYGQRKETESQRSIYSISGKELIIDNKGKCPENCNVTFTLTENRNGKIHILRNFSGTMMYGMVPAQLSFKTKDGKNKINGFVMKFWEWSYNSNTNSNNNYKEFFDIKRNKRSSQKEFSKNSFNFKSSSLNNENNNEFNLFENSIHKRNSYKISSNYDYTRSKRNLKNITYKQKNENLNTNNNILLNNYQMRLIRETVFLIIFNSADTHIENTSQSNIIQFCRNDNNEIICQPDLNYQENSILIADLDQDGSQELLSYYTTFVNHNTNNNSNGNDKKSNNLNKTDGIIKNYKDWKLVTYVTMLRLESELPTLYEVNKHN